MFTLTFSEKGPFHAADPAHSNPFTLMSPSLQAHPHMKSALPTSIAVRAVSSRVRCVRSVHISRGRRAVATSASARPIVQISLKDFATRKQEIAAELWKAATDVGFFYLKDHELTEVRLALRSAFART